MAAAFQPNAFQHNFQVADLVEVPDVVGETEGDGTTTLEAAGFVVVSVEEYSNVVAAGTIISQAPTGGSFAADGSTVVITVSLGESAGGWSARRRRRMGRGR